MGNLGEQQVRMEDTKNMYILSPRRYAHLVGFRVGNRVGNRVGILVGEGVTFISVTVNEVDLDDPIPIKSSLESASLSPPLQRM